MMFLDIKRVFLELIKNIFSAGVLSGLNSLSGFLFTLIIIQEVGLAPLGSVTIYLSVVSIGTFPLFLLPSSYSIVKIQDSDEFKNYFKSLLFIVSLFSCFVSIFLSFIFVDDVYVSILIPVYAILQVWQGFYDVSYQSKGFQVKYFFAVSSSSFVKLGVLLVWILFNDGNNSLDRSLFCVMFIGQVLLVMALAKGSPCKSGPLTLNAGVFDYYRSIYNEIKGFFLVSILKRAFDSIPPIVVERFYSLELVGLFSLMLKILNVSTTFAKILEISLLKRGGNEGPNCKIKFLVIIVGVIMTITISTFYTTFISKIDLLMILILSFTSILMAMSMFVRSTLTLTYNSRTLSLSYIVALSTLTILLVSLSAFDKYGIAFSYMIAVFSMCLLMSFQLNK